MKENGPFQDDIYTSTHRESLYTYRHKMGINTYTNFDMRYVPKRTGHWAAFSLTGIWRPDWTSGATEIFHDYVGIPAGYMGTVPGAKFRHGASYTTLSKGAKKFVRGEEKY